MRPRSGVVCKEFFVLFNGRFDEVEHLRREQSRAVRLVEVFFVSAHFFACEVAVFVNFVFHPVVRRHIVDVVAAVEIVEALVGGKVLTVVAEIPFAYAARVVACRLQDFGKGDFVAQNSVHVAKELIGVEKVRGRPRI